MFEFPPNRLLFHTVFWCLLELEPDKRGSLLEPTLRLFIVGLVTRIHVTMVEGIEKDLDKIKWLEEELASGMDLISSIARECVNNMHLTKNEEELMALKDMAQTFVQEDEENRFLHEAVQDTKRKIIAEKFENPDLIEDRLEAAISQARGKERAKTQLKATYEGICKFIDHSLIGGTEKEQVDLAEDESLIMTGHSKPTIPIDPVSQREVTTAVRNIRCNHVYDKDTIIQYANQGRRRCPALGCGNQELLIEDMIPDLEIQLEIDLKHKWRK